MIINNTDEDGIRLLFLEALFDKILSKSGFNDKNSREKEF